MSGKGKVLILYASLFVLYIWVYDRLLRFFVTPLLLDTQGKQRPWPKYVTYDSWALEGLRKLYHWSSANISSGPPMF